MWKNIIASVVLGVMSGSALALGNFSRACQFSEIPSVLQAIASSIFYSMGADVDTEYLENRADKANFWILESITADYLLLRYYLYAESYAYQFNYGVGNWLLIASYDSGGFRAQKIDDSITQAEVYKDIYNNNRQYFYSARAGAPGIYNKPPHPTYPHRVRGRHAYYDPKTKVMTRLPDTIASDCNLTEWGLWVR